MGTVTTINGNFVTISHAVGPSLKGQLFRKLLGMAQSMQKKIEKKYLLFFIQKWKYLDSHYRYKLFSCRFGILGQNYPRKGFVYLANF